MKPDLKGLTKLAKVLRRVPRKQFDMGQWIKETPCGTSGCIAGWAALTFPSRFRKTDGWEDSDGHKMYDVQHRSSGAIGEEAFANGFKISLDDATDVTLRERGMKRTPKMAANAIMALVGRLKKQVGK